MRSGLVIVQLPVINDFLGMKNIAEPVFIQAFIPQAVVEALNKSVLRWLTLDKQHLHTMLKSLLNKRAADKFWP